MLQIEIEVIESDLPPEAFRIVSAKIAQLPMILTTVVIDEIAPVCAGF